VNQVTCNLTLAHNIITIETAESLKVSVTPMQWEALLSSAIACKISYQKTSKCGVVIRHIQCWIRISSRRIYLVVEWGKLHCCYYVIGHGLDSILSLGGSRQRSTVAATQVCHTNKSLELAYTYKWWRTVLNVKYT